MDLALLRRQARKRNALEMGFGVGNSRNARVPDALPMGMLLGGSRTKTWFTQLLCLVPAISMSASVMILGQGGDLLCC
jgi:hypothetical protein